GGAPEPAPRASLAEPDHPAWAATVETDRGPGDALYGRHCAACHGPTGRGDGWNAPNLPVPPTAHADAGLMEGRADDALFDGIHGGARVLDGSPRMPPFGSLLGTGEIRALVATIRSLCDCSGPAWASDGHGDGR
ncbi:MAG TPA: cytochrome c, partial [Longimicrobiales bacterium]|nr:cytochrome c [Longimicrobiales bacterium]